MRLLILGGTVFLGRHVAEAALARDHDVTLLHRGRHGSELFAGDAEHVLADRDGDLAALRPRSFDAAIDTSGMTGAQLATSASLDLGHYVFVSSANAYRDWPAQPVTEDSPTWEQDAEDYGPGKAAAERAAEAAMPGRTTVVRAGIIAGPHDFVFRVPWWLAQLAGGGERPAPGPPDRTIQIIDARDLAGFLVDAAERPVPGRFNATSPLGACSFGELVDGAIAVTGSDAQPRWLSDEQLLAAGVEPWTELPLWAPQDEMPGVWGIDTTRAQAAGLRCRPLEQTLADTWTWMREDVASIGDYGSERRPPAMTAARVRELNLL